MISLYPIHLYGNSTGDISKRSKLSLYPIYHYIQYITISNITISNMYCIALLEKLDFILSLVKSSEMALNLIGFDLGLGLKPPKIIKAGLASGF